MSQQQQSSHQYANGHSYQQHHAHNGAHSKLRQEHMTMPALADEDEKSESFIHGTDKSSASSQSPGPHFGTQSRFRPYQRLDQKSSSPPPSNSLLSRSTNKPRRSSYSSLSSSHSASDLIGIRSQRSSSPPQMQNPMQPTMTNPMQSTMANPMQPTMTNSMKPSMANSMQSTMANSMKTPMANSLLSTMSDSMKPTIPKPQQPPMSNSLLPTIPKPQQPPTPHTLHFGSKFMSQSLLQTPTPQAKKMMTPITVIQRRWFTESQKELHQELQKLDQKYVIEFAKVGVGGEIIEILTAATSPREFARYNRQVSDIPESLSTEEQTKKKKELKDELLASFAASQRTKKADFGLTATIVKYSPPSRYSFGNRTTTLIYDAQEVDVRKAMQDTHTKLQQRLDQAQSEFRAKQSAFEKQKSALYAELQQTRSQVEEKQKEIRDLQQQLQRSYFVNPVETHQSKIVDEVSAEKKTQQRQAEAQQMIDAHATRLNEWSASNLKLAKFLETKRSEHGDDDDDEKRPQDESQPFNAKRLLEIYIECMSVLQTQQSRSREISQYVVQLSKPKKEFKQIIKQRSNKHQALQQECNALSATYTNLKSQREHLDSKISKLVAEINAVIDEENAANKTQCEKADELKVKKAEQEIYDALLENCKSLTKQYKQFREDVTKKGKQIESQFASKWIEHEKAWPRWSVDDIICWIQYLIHGQKVKLSEDVDLETVTKEMETAKFTGKLLPKMEETHLKLFGFTNYQDIIQIFKEIKNLVEKYPDEQDANVGGGDDMEGGVMDTSQSVTIPKEYLCSISNTIMMDPVIYEGVTYDRQNLMSYTQQNGVIPGTDEPFDEDELFEDMDLKEKIDAFLAENPQCAQEGI